MADRQSHAVSDADLGATRQLLAATPGLVGEPSDAERARTVIALATHATLATVAADRSVGYPFGSLVACAADDAGRTVLCLSDLAVHAVNLGADPRASLLVAAQAVGDPLAAARVTVVGDLREVSPAERAAVRDAYRRVHVDAFYAGFADHRDPRRGERVAHGLRRDQHRCARVRTQVDRVHGEVGEAQHGPARVVGRTGHQRTERVAHRPIGGTADEPVLWQGTSGHALVRDPQGVPLAVHAE